MRLSALLPLLSCFIFIIIGAAVYSKNPRAPLNKSFTLFSALLFYYSFTQFMLRNAELYSAAFIWAALHKPALVFLTPAFLNVILIYTRELEGSKNKWLVYGAIYFPAVVASLILASHKWLQASTPMQQH